MIAVENGCGTRENTTTTHVISKWNTIPLQADTEQLVKYFSVPGGRGNVRNNNNTNTVPLQKDAEKYFL